MEKESWTTRLSHAVDVFRNKDKPLPADVGISTGNNITSVRPSVSFIREGTVVSAIYNRIAIDVSSLKFRHVITDQNGNYKDDKKTLLNNCLTVSANIDQTHTDFIQELVLTMFQIGHAVIVPVDTTYDIIGSNAFDIETMRVGQVVEWFAQNVRVRLYNDKTGNQEDLVLPKSSVAIIKNPMYEVMNQNNSTLKRLLRKLSLLDVADEKNAAGKLDLLLTLPYAIRSEAKQQQARKRQQAIVDQLKDSTHGIAYIDATEKVTQLNRPVENNLPTQIENLTRMLYSQLGMTESVMDGTAPENVMLNYFSISVEPVATAITNGIRKSFLTKTARTQLQDIMYFRDAFKLAPVEKLAELADKFTRNEIMAPNEVRAVIGLKPSPDPKADELRNRNLNQPEQGMEEEYSEDEYED